jgi:hypothetical protein
MSFGFDELNGAKIVAEDLANTFDAWAEEFTEGTELTPAQRSLLAEQLAEVTEAVQALLA